MILTPDRPRSSLQSQHRRQQLLPDPLQIPHQQFELLQLASRPQQAQQNALGLSVDSAFATVDLNLNLDLDFDLDLDVDAELASQQSLSSSPLSTQSLLSQYSGSLQHSPLSTFESLPGLTGCSLKAPPSLFGPSPTTRSAIGDPTVSLFPGADSMPDAWVHPSRSVIRSARRAALHQRDSSISSLSSTAGPASPYSQNFANPRIAVTDSLGDLYSPGSLDDELQQLRAGKQFPPMTHHDSYYSSFPAYNTDASALAAAYPNVAAVPTTNRSLRIPGAAEAMAAKNQRPLSVASSVGSDSPATPAGEPEDDTRRRKSVRHVVPKLDRTMTDVYGDELYSPNFSMAPASSVPIPVPVSPNHHIFAQALQAANSQHLTASQSPVSTVSTGMSPFRQNSPLAPAPVHDFSTVLDPIQPRWRTSRQPSQLSKMTSDARSQNTGSSVGESPQTISPKDAVLEYHETDGDDNFPLFPPDVKAELDDEQISKAMAAVQSQQLLEGGLSLDNEAFNHLLNTQLSNNLQFAQQYPYIAQPQPEQRQQKQEAPQQQQQQQQQQQPARDVSANHSTSLSAAIGTTPSSRVGGSLQRPASTAADGGTYTCTYHGCTRRFETPVLLQKHKREGHRHPNAPGGRRSEVTATPSITTSSLFNTQAGPHRCDRINPSTGKPCAQIFSRPYDLTRHEDTIHNARKLKVRCDLCTEEKTFSRADALTRHYRVCHPGHEPQGKHRKRAAAAAAAARGG